MIEWRRDHAFDPSVGSSEEENYMASPSQAGMADADVGTLACFAANLTKFSVGISPLVCQQHRS